MVSKLAPLVDGKIATMTHAYPKSEYPYRKRKKNISTGLMFDKTVKLKMIVPMIEL